jgi:hypothetical protein
LLSSGDHALPGRPLRSSRSTSLNGDTSADGLPCPRIVRSAGAFGDPGVCLPIAAHSRSPGLWRSNAARALSSAAEAP